MSATLETRIVGSFSRLVLPPLSRPFNAREYFKGQPGLWAHPSFLTWIVARVRGDVAGEDNLPLLGFSMQDLLISKGGDVAVLRSKEIEDLLPAQYLFTEEEVCRVIKQVKDGDLTLERGAHQFFLRDSFACLFWSEDGPLGRWCVTSLERAANEKLMTRVDFVWVPEK